MSMWLYIMYGVRACMCLCVGFGFGCLCVCSYVKNRAQVKLLTQQIHLYEYTAGVRRQGYSRTGGGDMEVSVLIGERE